MKIIAEGKRHLGTIIGSTEYRDEYVKDLVKGWNNQLTTLSTTEETQPQAAYLPMGLKANLTTSWEPSETFALTVTSRKNN